MAGFQENAAQFCGLKIKDLLSTLNVNPDANAAQTSINEFKLPDILTLITSK